MIQKTHTLLIIDKLNVMPVQSVISCYEYLETLFKKIINVCKDNKLCLVVRVNFFLYSALHTLMIYRI